MLPIPLIPSPINLMLIGKLCAKRNWWCLQRRRWTIEKTNKTHFLYCECESLYPNIHSFRCWLIHVQELLILSNPLPISLMVTGILLSRRTWWGWQRSGWTTGRSIFWQQHTTGPPSGQLLLTMNWKVWTRGGSWERDWSASHSHGKTLIALLPWLCWYIQQPTAQRKWSSFQRLYTKLKIRTWSFLEGLISCCL